MIPATFLLSDMNIGIICLPPVRDHAAKSKRRQRPFGAQQRERFSVELKDILNITRHQFDFLISKHVTRRVFVFRWRAECTVLALGYC